MNKAYLVICAFCILLGSGCSPKNIMYGTYDNTKSYGVYYSMIINRDSTFNYYWKQGLNSEKISGFWTKKGNYLFLTSDRQSEDSLEIKEDSNPVSKYTTIFTKNLDSSDLFNVFIKVNDTLQLETNDSGYVTFSNVKPSKIDFTFLLKQKISYNVKNTHSNVFNVFYRFDSRKIFFKKNRVKVKSNYLILQGSDPENLKLTRSQIDKKNS